MTTSKKINFNIKKALGNPVTLLISMGLGILAGKFFPQVLPFTDFFATIYMKLLQMGVIPLAFAAVAVNISTLLAKEYREVLVKVILAALAVLFVSSSVGTFTGVALKDFLTPGEETKNYIATLSSEDNDGYKPTFEVVSYYNSTDEKNDSKNEYSVGDFILNIVPENIFHSLTSGNILNVIFFSMILGIMLSVVGEDKSRSLIKALEVVYQAFCRLINTILTVLPVGLFCILANQFANPGMSTILSALIKLIIMIYAVCFIIIALTFIVIQIKTRCSVVTHLKAIQRTFFLAISTSSCIATLAVATEDIINHFKLKESLTRSVVPIMITTIQSGVIASTAIIMVFACLLYGVPLSGNVILLILVGSIFYAFSIIGVPGLVAATMLSIVSTPLGIPSDMIAIIAISIVLFFDPIAVFSSVYCDIAVATCIVPKETVREEIKDEIRA